MNNKMNINLLLIMCTVLLSACSGVQFIVQNDLYQSKNDMVVDDPITTRNIGPSSELKRDGWELTWRDEFEDSELDDFKWGVGHGVSPDTTQLQVFIKNGANHFVKNGFLHFKLVQRSQPLDNKLYSCAQLTTRGKAHWTAGRVDVRAKIPVQAGVHTFFSLVPHKENSNSQLTILKADGEDYKRTEHGVLHQKDKWTLKQSKVQGKNKAQSFHVYSMEWDKQKIKWYIDDKLVHELSQDEVESGQTLFGKSFNLRLENIIGGKNNSLPDIDTVLPKYMFVDYVRVYKKKSNS